MGFCRTNLGICFRRKQNHSFRSSGVIFFLNALANLTLSALYGKTGTQNTLPTQDPLSHPSDDSSPREAKDYSAHNPRLTITNRRSIPNSFLLAEYKFKGTVEQHHRYFLYPTCSPWGEYKGGYRYFFSFSSTASGWMTDKHSSPLGQARFQQYLHGRLASIAFSSCP